MGMGSWSALDDFVDYALMMVILPQELQVSARLGHKAGCCAGGVGGGGDSRRWQGCLEVDEKGEIRRIKLAVVDVMLGEVDD